MTEQLFRDVLRALIADAEQRRYAAKEAGDADTADRWSAVAGNLDNARQRLRS